MKKRWEVMRNYYLKYTSMIIMVIMRKMMYTNMKHKSIMGRRKKRTRRKRNKPYGTYKYDNNGDNKEDDVQQYEI